MAKTAIALHLKETPTQRSKRQKMARAERWRAMCAAMEDPLAPAPRPESTELYRALIDAMGGEPNLSPQQLLLLQRVVVTKRRLDQLHAVIEQEGRLEFMSAEVSYTHALVGLLKTIGLQRVARDVKSLDQMIAAAREESEGSES